MKLLILSLALLLGCSGAAQADPVSAAVAATISSWGVGAATASVVAGFLVNTVSSIAMSALATAIRGKPDLQQPGISTETTTAGGTVPQRLILGSYCTAGQMVAPMMVYETDGNPNEWLVYVISLADKPVTALGRIFVDGRAYTIDGNPAASANADAMGATVLATPGPEGLRDKIFVRFHDGRQTAADAYLRRVFGTYPERPWTANMIGTGVAYVVVTFKGKAQDQDYSGFPAVKFEVDGHALYDPRDGTQNPANEATWKFTRNPAVIAYNILRGISVGGDRWGVGATDFALSDVIAAANTCAELVPVEGGGNRARYIAGLEVSVDDEPHTALTEIVKAMGGEVADMGGTWLLSAGEPGGPVLSITDDDIIVTDSRSLRPYPGLDETHNAIHASYPDPSQQWEAKEAVPLYNADYEAKDGGRRLIAEVDFPAVPSPRQVRALMREMLADHRRHRTHVITLPPDALGVRLGDHIAWSSVINGYNAKLFAVKAMGVDPVSLCVALTITERDPEDYDYDAGSDAVVPTIPSVQPVVPVIEGITGWTAVPVDAGGLPGIRMSWNPDINARAVSWNIRLASSGEAANTGSVSDVSRGSVVIAAGLRPNTAYRVAGRLILNRQTTATQEIIVTTLDLGLGWDDLAVEVRESITAFEAFMDSTPALLDDINAEISLVDQLARDNLLVAQHYTDTSVQSETVARQTEAGQLAARIDQITAANTSDNLLVNPTFSDGATGWQGVTVDNGKATVQAGNAIQTVSPAFGVGELLQWRLEHNGPAGQVRIGFQDSSNAVIGSEVVTNLPASGPVRVASGQHTPPDGTVKVRFRVAGEGLVIDNVVVSKLDQQTVARIQALEAAVANDKEALASYKTEANARLSNAETGQTSNANAISALTSRVTNTEGVNSSQSASLTQLNNSMYAADGKVEAQVAATNALRTRVTSTENGIAALSDSVTAVTARTDRTHGAGLLRISAEAARSGAQTTIGLRAEAGINDSSHSAGLYLSAKSDGTSEAAVVSNRFYVAHGDATDSNRTVPFIIANNRVIMSNAIVDTLSIAGNAVIVPVATAENNEVRLGTVGSVGTVSAAAINNPTGAPVFILFNGQQAGAGPAMCDYYIFRNSTQLRSIRHTSFDNGQQTSMVLSAVDLSPPVGASNYTVRAAKASAGGYTNDVVLTNRTLSLQAVQR